LSSGGVAPGDAGDELVLEQIGHVARGRIIKGGEVGRLGVDAKVAEPEIGRDEGAHGGVLEGRAVCWCVAQADGVVAIVAVARHAQVLLVPQPVEANVVPRARVGVVEDAAAAVEARLVHVQRRHVDAVCPFRRTGHGIDGPRLLRGRRHQGSDGLCAIAHAQRDRVPAAIDAVPVLRGRHGDGLGRAGALRGETGLDDGGQEGSAGQESQRATGGAHGRSVSAALVITEGCSVGADVARASSSSSLSRGLTNVELERGKRWKRWKRGRGHGESEA
jgi:hypothetical protein